MTPSSPTPSRRSSRLLRCVLLAAAGACRLSPGLAHDVAAQPVPESPGWRVGAGVAVTAVGASKPLPSPTLPGVLDTGQVAFDRRGLRVEHAVLGAGVRVNRWLGAHLGVGWHGDEAAHLESAWVHTRWAGDAATWTLGVGRDKVPMGAVLTGAGDFDRFALLPLVKRGSLGDDWTDDGAVLSWRGGGASLLRGVDLGVWRGRGFPGGGDMPAVPSLHVQMAVAEFELDGFYAHLQPAGRGTFAQASNAGHTHAVPDCSKSLIGLVCLEGRVNLVGGSVSWEPSAWPLQLSGAVLWRDERGALYSRDGNAAYRGRTLGGWIDAVWDWRDDWQLAARAETLSATHDMSGPGASLVAAAAGLVPNQPARRFTAALTYRHAPDWRIAAEIGHERSSGNANPFVMLRAVWTAPWLWSGAW